MTDYCTADQLKAELRITDTTEDELIALACSAASEQIDHYCGQSFTADSTATARYFRPDSNLCVYVDNIASTTDLVVKVDQDGDGTYETTVSASEYQLEPRNAASIGQPWNEVLLFGDGITFPSLSTRYAVEVTAKWGWPTVPPSVEKAARVQAAQLYKAKDTAFGVAGTGEFGVLRIQARMNPVAAALLAGFRLPAVG